MTDEEWAELKPFAEAEDAARRAFQMAAARNTPTDLREQVESAAAYERAKADWFKASSELDAARRRLIGA